MVNGPICAGMDTGSGIAVGPLARDRWLRSQNRPPRCLKAPGVPLFAMASREEAREEASKEGVGGGRSGVQQRHLLKIYDYLYPHHRPTILALPV